ncbi:flagellar basal body P-ring formation chaperone FlgA [Rhodobacter calidifons]|uniref:Flagella basal body P-ring formation protein FlgA n=1 Tax=Rhodobacter calidifons TaxID=2715277 RepID=A0ABX0G656_9RHOB|nr:flagellar basal body P-ring formation chaperone FlgA [Rhodobacter calidifons]NHB76674.1 flagellar basal body P-ring formation protein FlgA [Rhodobacter calidifons]
MWRVILLLVVAQPAFAESVVASRTIRAKAIVQPDDLVVVDAELPGSIQDPAAAFGLEARVTIYAGKPVRLADLGPPTMVERNQLVTLVYLSGGLAIATEGRSLGRAAEGESVRVMNIGSRNTVTGRVGPDGTVYVGWKE